MRRCAWAPLLLASVWLAASEARESPSASELRRRGTHSPLLAGDMLVATVGDTAPSVDVGSGIAITQQLEVRPAHPEVHVRFRKEATDPSSSSWRRAMKRTRRAFRKHWDQIAIHSAYIAAIAARNGRRMWAGRSVLAELLERFRLTAFTSEVGESFRPLAAAWQVTFAYAVSWTYVLLDIALRTCDEHALRGSGVHTLRTFVFFSLFHTVATMLLPAVLIHAAVHHSERLFKLATLRGLEPEAALPALLRLMERVAWIAPSLIGLALIPLMPLLDEPLEELLGAVFRRVWPLPSRRKRKPTALTDWELANADLMRGAGVDSGGQVQVGSALSISSSATGNATAAPRGIASRAPVNREEPELRRATGYGEPEYRDVNAGGPSDASGPGGGGGAAPPAPPPSGHSP